MAAAEEVDVVVLGMGPGGESVAGELAAAGLSVVGVEARLVGGECPYYGCVPSKMMIRAGNVVAEALRVPGLAGTVQLTPDFSKVAGRIRSEATDNWDDAVAAKRFTDKGGRLVRGTGRLTGSLEVTVSTSDDGDLIFRARLAVVVNPGTNPTIPSVPGLEGTPFWTNREAVQAESAPKSLAVLGGGPIAVELAQAFTRFGTKVTMVLRGSSLLSRSEPEAGELLAQVFRSEGIKILHNKEVTGVVQSRGRFRLALADSSSGKAPGDGARGSGVSQLSAEKFLVATGRTARLSPLNLAAAGVEWDGSVAPAVDPHMQLTDGVYLIGDAAGEGAFTHMSMYQGNIVAGHILARHAQQQGDSQPPDRGATESHAVPNVTFTDPEVGSVGLTEKQARDAGLSIRVGLTKLDASTRGWIHKSGNQGFIKIIEDTQTGVLVGATSAGPSGGEVLSALVLAVHARIPVATLKTMIYAYPTFHRAIPEALAALK
ncbi:Pyruvate/2-oxoglutarate dehydrogenase complex, dihydrolipoamide dehydrogenase (E3) component [Arthrobacter alpinus]|uniref:Pyruvate/2-oxoglutarate dehydrogenase complex, dihydrolipoamide dehydrogenase (E3) component n=1 Tax=Arthrobacter alpinus TaxID=656366 RepID=A0A1H5MT59_9MICC|nr:NAD(P)/FAD-dependent oxidoreductase [Arthrobacter alpinus]SEE91937.1 Pyruvate/2-oxoglutarate dehydrogenase complex, dihydrolipoamide dehydrogenase (E3) component [Arthrobacter alpinus]